MIDILGILALLIGLELVLGVDNILVITILVNRLKVEEQNKARILGLALAMVARILLLFLLLKLTGLTQSVLYGFSVRDIILILGGLFLIYKAVHEIHHIVELKDEDEARHPNKHTFGNVITQIVLLDIVFSVDSVITAIGLTELVWVIVTAVILSFAVILIFARPIGNFITQNPTLKILALSFLISIGITIFMEGLHKEVPKAYIYLPMGFALGVELLQMRYSRNKAANSNK